MSIIGLHKPPQQAVGPALAPGDDAPYLEAMQADKARYLVAFIRHVGCPFAERTVRKLRALAPLHPDLQCIIVSHGDPQTTERWLRSIGGAQGLTWVYDPQRQHYGAYGVGYSSARHFLGPASLLGVAALLTRGIRNRSASGTRWQPAATFLLDASRSVLWCHRPAHAADVPRLSQVLHGYAADAAGSGPQAVDTAGKLRVQVLEHSPHEGIGNIERWLLWHNAQLRTTRLYSGTDPLPDPEDCDLIILMGGAMSVNDEAGHPWLAWEKAFIREAVARGRAILGICLGAQVIASALGARVYALERPEIGWLDIQATPATSGSFRFPGRLPVLHWHGEGCELPPGAILLADSAACPVQAFQVGTRILGLQFHLEVTPRSLEAMIEHESDDLHGHTGLPDANQLRDVPHHFFSRNGQLMDTVLSYLTRQLPAGADRRDNSPATQAD